MAECACSKSFKLSPCLVIIPVSGNWWVIALGLYSRGQPAGHKARPLFWSASMADIVPLCPSFWSFVFYLQLSLWHPTLPRSTEGRPPFPLARLHFPSSPPPSAHKERAANPDFPLIKLHQWAEPFHLHGDGTRQSQVSEWSDFDPSTQWRWEV